MSIEKETKANFEKFYTAWTAQIVKNHEDLHGFDKYLQSYRRISAVNSLRVDVVEPAITKNAQAFFLEAHNDLLQSHVSASVGSWRVALKSVRSFVENSLSCLYFADHPIELRNWERGKSRPSFSGLVKYFEDHPDLSGCTVAKSALTNLVSEYAQLSKAVHGSAKSFRMTDDVGQTLLWSVKQEKVGAWSTRESAAISNVALIIVCIFKDRLSGAKLQGCREALGYIFGQKVRDKIKMDMGVNVPNPS